MLVGVEHRARQPEPPNATTARVYHFPEFAAEGGPPPQGPSIDPQRITADTAAAVALIFDELTERWIVISGDGEVYAEASDPGDLADWLNDYAVTLGDMYARGEL
jgi:hypothetical protein